MTGKSSAPDSLQIATHRLKKVEYESDFVPSGADSHGSRGPAVTMGSGVLGLELFNAAAEGKFLIVSGICSSVGTGGGYILGGGASPLNRPFGLASDNALEFTMVTADVGPRLLEVIQRSNSYQGELVVANEFQNEDLFWALKGGGGGTFGVVMSVTVRVYPDMPATHVTLNLTLPAESETFWDAAHELFAVQAALAGERDHIFISILPYTPTDPTTGTLRVDGTFYNGSLASADQKFVPLREALDSTGAPYTYQSEYLPSYSVYKTTPLFIDVAGGGHVHGSVLVSEQLYHSADGPSKLVDTFKKLQLAPGGMIEITTFGGGQVAENRDLVDSAVHPSWREALSLIDLYINLPGNSSFQMQKQAQDFLTDVQMPLLVAMESGRMGSYVNGADAKQKNFQTLLWGDNYERLYQIKQKWDKDGLFICTKAVGSEDWDEEGMCRKSKHEFGGG